MTIRLSLLTILDQGPCYGYQLRTEFERRTAGTWSLNVGQVYSTLDRLERDGFVTKGALDDSGHVLYEITEVGTAEARDWIQSEVPRAFAIKDEFVLKLTLAATLPGADPQALIAAQRRATTHALAQWADEADVDDLASRLTRAAIRSAAEAELAWLDACEELVRTGEPFALEAEPPRRGRPARAS